MEILSLVMSEVLEVLFGSKSKVRVLRFFLLNAEGEYAIDEIAKKNMLTLAAVRKEINALKKIGLIREKNKKGKKVYQLNQQFHFGAELRSLFSRSTASPESKTLLRLKTVGDVKLALISGIFLDHPKSKVDLVLVVNNVNRSKLKNVMNTLEAEIGKEVSFALMNSDEFKYRLDMLDRFLLDFLAGPHTELVDKIPGLKRFILGLKKY